MQKKADQLVFAECGRHNEKPAVVHKVIEECWDTDKGLKCLLEKREMGGKVGGTRYRTPLIFKKLVYRKMRFDELPCDVLCHIFGWAYWTIPLSSFAEPLVRRGFKNRT